MNLERQKMDEVRTWILRRSLGASGGFNECALGALARRYGISFVLQDFTCERCNRKASE